jgi:DNA-binding transcriptional ArsR family regulator
MESSPLAVCAEALAHATRLRIVGLLKQAPDGVTAGDIAARLEVRPTTLSSHLKVLTMAGLIEPDRAWRTRVYRYRPEAGLNLVDELRAFLSPTS